MTNIQKLVDYIISKGYVANETKTALEIRNEFKKKFNIEYTTSYVNLVRYRIRKGVLGNTVDVQPVVHEKLVGELPKEVSASEIVSLNYAELAIPKQEVSVKISEVNAVRECIKVVGSADRLLEVVKFMQELGI